MPPARSSEPAPVTHFVGPPQRILCPVDFSDASRDAIDHAMSLARAAQGAAGCSIGELVMVGRARRQVLRAAQDLGAGLIVLGLHVADGSTAR